jgi:hypothetical protein
MGTLTPGASEWDPSRKKGVHLKDVHLIGAYFSQDGYLRCLYLMGVTLLRACIS